MLFLMFLFGCSEESNCSTEVVNAVEIELVDQEGQPVSGDVQYSLNDEDSIAVVEGGTGIYVISEEVAGDYEIFITVEIQTSEDPMCWDYGTATLNVTVEEDDCHVITQSLSPTLEWENNCTEEAD